MALWDAIVRVLIGAILVFLDLEKDGIFEIGFWVGIILILSAIVGFCPLYKISGISTKCEDETCKS
jgi:hypothetical protein